VLQPEFRLFYSIGVLMFVERSQRVAEVGVLVGLRR